MKPITAVLTIALVLLAGCATAGRKVDPNAVSQVQRGTSTKTDVRASLGEPTQISTDDDGETWVYAWARSSVDGKTFIPFAGAFIGGTRTDSQSVEIRFDKAGVVQSVKTTHSGMDAQMGK